jgi:uncharacterized membrane protein (Fun14 family)
VAIFLVASTLEEPLKVTWKEDEAKVAIENIAAATNSFSPLLTSIGFSGLIGFLVGIAIKQVMKILAVGAGIFFAALMYLESQNIVNVNWDKLQTVSQNAVSTLTNAAGQFPITSTTTSSSNFALSMTGTAALGFAVGFMKSWGIQMFNFLKKLKPQHEIPELEQQLTPRKPPIHY